MNANLPENKQNVMTILPLILQSAICILWIHLFSWVPIFHGSIKTYTFMDIKFCGSAKVCIQAYGKFVIRLIFGSPVHIKSIKIGIQQKIRNPQ